ncbi:hypothetical protein F511_27692 [Dorcoceras hygrometricum]|uniref:Uncharacterized protein n=1 Tax=Dorcoceras hygrometricum TaxID=472368 RepID=A0A2Z7CG75_9LAMI|nr:hypothetical protein F511_27692 [Dorcoceras hygrometricum]
MRSVVASHGPGSNPKGDAICNAILLQCFPVLQIFGLQYLDRHLHRLRMPPTKSSPKFLKFQNRPTRARYRIPARKLHGLLGTGPNQTLEEISRHDIARASPERRPPAAAPPRKIARGTKATLGRSIAHRLASHVASPCAHHSTTAQQGAQPAADLHRDAAPREVQQRPAIMAQSRGQRAPVMRDKRASCAPSSAAADRATTCAKRHDQRGRDARSATVHSAASARWKSHSPKSSSHAQHIELSIRAGISNQYLCDPQWFRDTASRGPTTIVAPESQFRTCPTDHGKSV